MKFSIDKDQLLRSLNYCQGVIEKRSTLPILSNVLIEAKNSSIKITATDLDLIFIHEIKNVKIEKEGSTTTSSSIIYDIIRKLSPENLINFNLINENKIQLESDKSEFNLNCLSPKDFPLVNENFTDNEFLINSHSLLKLINKCKFSISNDETRHYLNGIYIHSTVSNKKSYLTGVATDSHRLSSSSIPVENLDNFKSFILPKKTVFQLCNLLQENEKKVFLNTSDTKIQFKIGNSKIISKIIDGKFPDYHKVVPKNNNKTLLVNAKDFIHSIERVTTVSIDRKEGVKLTLGKDYIQLFVTSSSSGEGKEVLKANYNSEDLTISFNSRYLLDIASEIEDEKLVMNLNDSVSPVLIQDKLDKQSYFVIMPMKI